MSVLQSKRLSWLSRCPLICVALLSSGAHQASAQERMVWTTAIREDRPTHDFFGRSHQIQATTSPATTSRFSRAAEAEPNNKLASANEAELGSVIEGRIARPGDFDVFTITAAAGTALDLEVAARGIGSPLDPTLCLFDESGTRIAHNIVFDGFDSRIRFTVPTSGRYFINVRGFGGSGGPNHTYRLTIGSTEPGSADPTTELSAS